MPDPAPSSVSRRPYLLRAMHQWIGDSGYTPHIIVDAGVEGVDVPRQFVKDGKIVLNASYAATHGLQISNDWVEFSARFGGATRQVRVPMKAVLGVYARETGEGMAFTDSDMAPEPPDGGGKPTPTPEDDRRARFKVVK